jgi:alcohol oxidase
MCSAFLLTRRLSGINAGIKMRPSQEDLKELGQEFEQTWKGFYAPAPDKPLIIMSIITG